MPATLILVLLYSLSSWAALNFDCLDLSSHPSGAQIYQDMRFLQKKFQLERPEISEPATAVGYCEHLNQTHVLAYLVEGPLKLPPRCAGFTFSVQKRRDVVAKAQLIYAIKDDVILGDEGIIQMNVNGQTLRLPICIDIIDELIGSPEKPRSEATLAET